VRHTDRNNKDEQYRLTISCDKNGQTVVLPVHIDVLSDLSKAIYRTQNNVWTILSDTIEHHGSALLVIGTLLLVFIVGYVIGPQFWQVFYRDGERGNFSEYYAQRERLNAGHINNSGMHMCSSDVSHAEPSVLGNWRTQVNNTTTSSPFSISDQSMRQRRSPTTKADAGASPSAIDQRLWTDRQRAVVLPQQQNLLPQPKRSSPLRPGAEKQQTSPY